MWSEPHPDRPLPLLESVWSDMVGSDDAPTTLRGRAKLVLSAASRSGFRCALNYRLAHSARANLGAPGKVIAGCLFWWGRHFYNCAITPTARLYGGLNFPHPTGISIGPDVVVGPQAWIFQNVCLVGAPRKAGTPKLGRNVALFAGAVVSGPVSLGDGVHVGANAVIARNVEAGMLVTAAPVQEASLKLLGWVRAPSRPSSELR